LAKAFLGAEYHVFATARNPATIGSFATEADVEVLALDVTSEESIAACLMEVHKKTDGRLDILVNNAGSAVFGPLIHASIAEVKGVYDVNVWGALAVAQAFVPLLYRAQGVMLNISSMAGAVPLAWQGIYNSSKAALTFLSETLRLELEPLGVRVVTAMVGAIGPTDIYRKSDKMTLPEDSWYIPIESLIAKQASGEMQEPNNEYVDVTARNIVLDTLRGCRGQVWRGGEAGMASLGSWLLPTRFRDWVLHQQRGLWQLRKYHSTISLDG